MKIRSTKKALAMSMLSLVLCFAMLAGTTYAWFTDSVTSSANKIVAGTLKIDLELLETDGTWTSIKTDPKPIFDYDKWEPGYTAVRILKIENEGTLALKWKAMFVSSESLSALADVIDVYVLPSATALVYPTSLDGYTRVGTVAEFVNTIEETTNGVLAASESAYLGIALVMQETAGNEYQGLDLGGAFDIQIAATQMTAEPDSFDNQYDADATYPIVPFNPVYTTTELLERLAAAEEGDVIFMAPGEFEISSTLSIPSGVTLYGAQAGNPAVNWANKTNVEKTVITYSGNSGGNAVQIYQNNGEVVQNVTLDGIMIDGADVAGKGLYVKKYNANAMVGIKIANCAVVNTTNDGMDIANTSGAIIENNYVADVVDNGIRFGNYKATNQYTGESVVAYVRNNYVENVSATANGAIMIDNGSGDVVVTGNVVKNVSTVDPLGSSAYKGSAITVYDVYEGGVITVSDNTVEDVDYGITVYTYTAIVEGESVIVKNNTVKDYNVFALGAVSLNSKKAKPAITTRVAFIDNVITSDVTDNAIYVKANSTNPWDVTTSGNTLNGAAVN